MSGEFARIDGDVFRLKATMEQLLAFFKTLQDAVAGGASKTEHVEAMLQQFIDNFADQHSVPFGEKGTVSSVRVSELPADLLRVRGAFDGVRSGALRFVAVDPWLDARAVVMQAMAEQSSASVGHIASVTSPLSRRCPRPRLVQLLQRGRCRSSLVSLYMSPLLCVRGGFS